MSTLRGKTIVVTGGTGGLGVPVVAELVAAGAHCRLPVYEERVPESVAALGSDVTATTGVDLTREIDVSRFYSDCGPIWASVHLAGGFSMAPIEDTSLGDLQAMLRLNLVTCFLCCREALGHMPNGGRIVNVGARPSVSPAPNLSAYSMSKAGVLALTQTLAAETRARDVLVNAILPSIIDTEQNRAAMPDADHGSWPTPAEIAGTIAFLVSEQNSLTSGAAIPVYGKA